MESVRSHARSIRPCFYTSCFDLPAPPPLWMPRVVVSSGVYGDKHQQASKMAQSGGSEAVSCISSEEDLQRMIELGSWYDSEEESSSEAEDTDSGSDRNHDEVG